MLEDEATRLIPAMFDKTSVLYSLTEKVSDLELIDGVCEACSKKMDTHNTPIQNGLNIIGDMMGHPSMEKYVTAGFEIITF